MNGFFSILPVAAIFASGILSRDISREEVSSLIAEFDGCSKKVEDCPAGYELIRLGIRDFKIVSSALGETHLDPKLDLRRKRLMVDLKLAEENFPKLGLLGQEDLGLAASAKSFQPLSEEIITDTVHAWLGQVYVNLGAAGFNNPRAKSAVYLLSEYLKHTNPDVRARALHVICLTSEKSAANLIAPMLEDSSSLVRRLACETLGAFRIASYSSNLEKRIHDEASGVRAEAILALRRLGTVTAEMVSALLEDESEAVRIQAAAVTLHAVALGKILSQSADPGMRREAAFEMGRLNEFERHGSSDSEENEPVRLLLSALKDQDSLVRVAAITALRPWGQRRHISQILLMLKDIAPEVRARVLDCAGEFARDIEGTADRILPYLEDPADRVRMSAAAALFRFGRNEDRARLEKLRNDQSEQVRRLAEALLEMHK